MSRHLESDTIVQPVQIFHDFVILMQTSSSYYDIIIFPCISLRIIFFTIISILPSSSSSSSFLHAPLHTWETTHGAPRRLL
eukprot:765269-Hanusia_phi.AAC.13